MTDNIQWKASYTLTEQEIKEAVEVTLVRPSKVKKLGMAIVIAVITVFFGVDCFYDFFGGTMGARIFLFAISAVALIAILLEPSLLSKKTVQEALQANKPADIKCVMNGIQFKAEDEIKYLQWEDFLVAEYENMYIIRLNSGYVLPVPKRVLEDRAKEMLSEVACEQDYFDKVLRGKKV